MKKVIINFDGGFGNGLATFGYVLKFDGKEVKGAGKYLDPRMTNNIAEYLGLLKGIQKAKVLIPDYKNYEFHIYGDSKLVVEHVGKRWGFNKTKSVWKPHDKFPFLQKILFSVLSELENIKYETFWVEREKNKSADSLSRVHR